MSWTEYYPECVIFKQRVLLWSKLSDEVRVEYLNIELLKKVILEGMYMKQKQICNKYSILLLFFLNILFM